jgi:hypothetical protein
MKRPNIKDFMRLDNGDSKYIIALNQYIDHLKNSRIKLLEEAVSNLEDVVFSEMKESPKAKQRKFKEGDKVIVVKQDHGHKFKLNSIVTIVEDRGYNYKCIDENGIAWACIDEELEHIIDQPQPIEGVKFDCDYDIPCGIIKDGKNLWWGDLYNTWVTSPKRPRSKPCHLVPVDKYTVGRVYRYDEVSGDVPSDYFLCVDIKNDSAIALRWSKNEKAPLIYDTVGTNMILEVQAI